MRRFKLLRTSDVSGVSGTGTVAEGAQFSNGQCVMRWFGIRSSIGIYKSIEDLIAIHDHSGTEHEGKNRIIWLDDKETVDKNEFECIIDNTKEETFANLKEVYKVKRADIKPGMILRDWGLILEVREADIGYIDYDSAYDGLGYTGKESFSDTVTVILEDSTEYKKRLISMITDLEESCISLNKDIESIKAIYNENST
jgi:hypothetical protein